MGEVRRGWSLIVFAVSLCASVLASCGDDAPESVEPAFTLPRAYEDLDLSTPEGAVAEFVSAFVRRDYVTAALILHRDTQLSMGAAVESGDLSGLVATELQASLLARLTVERDGDHVVEAGRAFEVAMEEAMANGGFHVDLASGVQAVTLRSSDQFTAVVDGVLATNGNDVIFELAPASDGRWRIRSVRLVNGVPSQVPFSGQPTTEPPDRGLEDTDVWRSILPNADPQELLDTIVAVVDQGDFVSLYLLLDTTAQNAVADQLAAVIDPDHGMIASILDARLDTVGFSADVSQLGNVPSDFMTTAEQVAPGEALTFMVSHGEDALDVTMSRDSTGGWRLRRMVPVGEITAPTPFVIAN
ncbi:MAG: hypothetical protein AAGA37_05270 [Actinomycetota bacterium]